VKKFWGVTKRFFLAHRLTILIIAGVLVVIGAYGVWSKVTWDDYALRYKNWQTQTKQQFDAALKLPVASDNDREEKLRALTSVSDKITDDKDSICALNALIGWQRFIQTLGDREKACQEARERLAGLGEDLNALVAYMADDQALAVIMKALAGKAELVEGEWAAQATTVHTSVDKIAKLKVQSNFSPVKQKATEVATRIDTAWQAVLAAHSGKDKAKYTQAQTELIQAYGSLGAISDISARQVEGLAGTVASSSQPAFK
jgi:hypothetical protein